MKKERRKIWILNIYENIPSILTELEIMLKYEVCLKFEFHSEWREFLLIHEEARTFHFHKKEKEKKIVGPSIFTKKKRKKKL